MKNKVEGTLSRHDEEASDLVEQCWVASMVELAWLEQVRAMVNQSSYY